MFSIPDHWITLPINPLSKTPMRKFKTDADKAALPPFLSIPDVNWAVIAQASGVTILDFDKLEGWAYCKKKVVAGWMPAPGLVVRTGSGKWHWYYRAPDEGQANAANLKGIGIDIRGNNGYCLIPPSIHPATKEPYIFESVAGTPDTWPVFDPAWLDIQPKQRRENPSADRQNIYVRETFERLLAQGYNPDRSKAGPMASNRPHVNGYRVRVEDKIFYIANGGTVFCVTTGERE